MKTFRELTRNVQRPYFDWVDPAPEAYIGVMIYRSDTAFPRIEIALWWIAVHIYWERWQRGYTRKLEE